MSRTTVHGTKTEKNEESTSSASEPSHHGKASKSSSSTGAVNADEVKSLLASITAVAGPPLALTAKDKVHAIRLRKGGEKVIPTITALSQQFGINLPSHPISAGAGFFFGRQGTAKRESTKDLGPEDRSRDPGAEARRLSRGAQPITAGRRRRWACRS